MMAKDQYSVSYLSIKIDLLGATLILNLWQKVPAVCASSFIKQEAGLNKYIGHARQQWVKGGKKPHLRR